MANNPTRALQPSSYNSSSNAFFWKIPVKNWSKAIVDADILELEFETSLPPDGKTAKWCLVVFPHICYGEEQVEVNLVMKHPHFDKEEIPKFQIETAYRIRKPSDTKAFDMYSMQSYETFHSSEFFDDMWISLENKHVFNAEECSMNGILTFEFEMRTFLAPKMKFLDSVSKQREVIIKNFEDFSSDGDVKLICNGREYSCHKLLLISQSPVFRAMFAQDCTENSGSSVAITDCSPEAVQEFLFFLYHAKHSQAQFTSAHLEFVFDLVHLASKYQIELLMASCKDVLLDIMNMDNVLKIKVLADKYPELKPITFMIDTFMKNNITEVVKKEDWVEFCVNNVSLLSEFISNNMTD